MPTVQWSLQCFKHKPQCILKGPLSAVAFLMSPVRPPQRVGGSYCGPSSALSAAKGSFPPSDQHSFTGVTFTANTNSTWYFLFQCRICPHSIVIYKYKFANFFLWLKKQMAAIKICLKKLWRSGVGEVR